MQVNIHEAKTRFSKLIIQASKGEEIIIARAGKPVAKLVALEKPKRSRKPGSARGLVTMSDDFDAPLPIQMNHGLYVHELPEIHKDPFDRLLVA
ncbi:MAG: type II toxin-antitoxin system Phd/YefM family antitoxin [Desulfocapsa sp.]|nr:MAG: type II toxin-antitoxin system Phd/YefM family antitoxin [Desulfocapsa sp.]